MSPFDDEPEIPPYGRVIFPHRVRAALFMEQRGRCRYCGWRMSSRRLEIDHKWPVSRNGGNEMSNLQLLCTACNLRKGIQTDVEFRDRYWRLLPPDGSIPDPPIPQDWFTEETQHTRASRTVRGIYRDRFERARRRRVTKWESGEPAPFFPFVIAVVLVMLVIFLIAAASQCGG